MEFAQALSPNTVKLDGTPGMFQMTVNHTAHFQLFVDFSRRLSFQMTYLNTNDPYIDLSANSMGQNSMAHETLTWTTGSTNPTNHHISLDTGSPISFRYKPITKSNFRKSRSPPNHPHSPFTKLKKKNTLSSISHLALICHHPVTLTFLMSKSTHKKAPIQLQSPK